MDHFFLFSDLFQKLPFLQEQSIILGRDLLLQCPFLGIRESWDYHGGTVNHTGASVCLNSSSIFHLAVSCPPVSLLCWLTLPVIPARRFFLVWLFYVTHFVGSHNFFSVCGHIKMYLSTWLHCGPSALSCILTL